MMQKRLVSIFLVALMTAMSFSASASDGAKEEVSHDEHHEIVNEDVDMRTQIKETIAHHLQDSHDFTITHGVSFPLPVILFDNGLHVFMSSKFEHETAVAESNGNYYKIYHSKVYKTDAEGTITYDEHHHVANATPFDMSNVFTIILMALFMFFTFKKVASAYKSGPMPKGAGRFLEPLVVFVRDEIAIPNIGEKHYKRYMSYLLTIFFFIWFLNLAGMTPLGIGVTNNIAITFSLALLTFLITQFTANKNYWAHIFWMPGVPKPMRIVLAPIELLGVFIKPFALMIRLYANMTAGHIVLMSIIGLIFIFQSWFASGAFLSLTLFLSLLELLVAALQAYIFTMLTALYFGAAVEEHH